MNTFRYNDMDFSLDAAEGRWDVSYRKPDGGLAYVGAGLFAGLAEAEALDRAKSLVRSIFPVGVRTVGPNVAHPNLIGDMKLVGPDVDHPDFVYWNKDSTSFPKEPA